MNNENHGRQAKQVIAFDTLTALPNAVQDQLAHKHRGIPLVAVLYYGGTVGMTKDPVSDRLVPTDNPEALLEPLVIKGLKEKFQVVWFQVYPKAIDSTNGRWWHWVSIANAIKVLYEQVDGFVVLGGTDTMTHLSSALNFIFPNIGKPVICTGSQIPMAYLGDDATRNLYFAMILAATGDLSGCHLAFADRLMHGLHAFKVRDRGFAAFEAPQRHQIGEFDGAVHLFPGAPRRNPLVTSGRLEMDIRFREGVKIVKLSPATPSESLNHDVRDPTCDAVLIITFGAGNIRDKAMFEGEETHVAIMNRLHEENYPFILGSPMVDGRVNSPYESGALAIDAGGISAQDTCGAALEVKMMRALAIAYDVETDTLNREVFRREMLRNHVGEVDH